MQTPAMLERCERFVAPAAALVDAAAADLLEHYPRATLAVLDGAGHALPHEQPELLAGLVQDWLTCTG